MARSSLPLNAGAGEEFHCEILGAHGNYNTYFYVYLILKFICFMCNNCFWLLDFFEEAETHLKSLMTDLFPHHTFEELIFGRWVYAHLPN